MKIITRYVNVKTFLKIKSDITWPQKMTLKGGDYKKIIQKKITFNELMIKVLIGLEFHSMLVNITGTKTT